MDACETIDEDKKSEIFRKLRKGMSINRVSTGNCIKLSSNHLHKNSHDSNRGYRDLSKYTDLV